MAQPTEATVNRIRAVNDRAALEALVEHGPLTRPEIGALLGLSKPTASQLLARLRNAGLVISDGTREGGIGRAPEVYRINPRLAHVACFDVTPERIAASIADLTGVVTGEFRLPTPTHDVSETIEQLRSALAGCCADAGIHGHELSRAVIGIQGAFNPSTGRLDYAAHLPGWRIPRLPETLRVQLGVSVSIENDVNLVAVAEQVEGVARAHPDFVLLWASDGLGMALVLDGRLRRGATGAAGEVGYMPIPGAELPRASSGPANYGFHELVGGPAVRRILRTHGFGARSPANAVQAAARAWGARSADAAGRASAAFGEIARRLATGLATVVSIADPELVVLAGDVVQAGGERLRELTERELHAMTIAKPPVRISTVAGNPVLAGAREVALAAIRNELFTT